ncbi:MAG: cytochrome c [Bryobacteraceae bacterium]
MKIAPILALLAVPLTAAPRAVTYHQDVAPILAKRCEGCHKQGEIAPMAFTSYGETRPWARAIRQAVLKGTMPPWHADAETTARYRNARVLTNEERDVLTSWAESGAAEGDPVAHPAIAAATEPSGWRLGKPDMVVRIPGYHVPESGTLQYTFLVTPTGFTEDTWVEAAEWKIDQRRVVHHINAFVRPPGSSYIASAPPRQLYVASTAERAIRKQDEREVDRRELLVGYEPGYRAQPWGEGRAKLIRKGSDIVFEMHYTANGKDVTDYSELGIYFARKAPRERILTLSPADNQFVIPPGDSNYRSFTSATFKRPVQLVSLQPHMHLRGKAYEIRATYPDGRHETLLNVPRYDFNWQTTYFLAKPMDLPAGAVLECVAWFDNSPNNRFNPDAAKEVRWGDQSWEEMNIGFTEIAFDATADPDVATLSGSTRPGSAPVQKRP